MHHHHHTCFRVGVDNTGWLSHTLCGYQFLRFSNIQNVLLLPAFPGSSLSLVSVQSKHCHYLPSHIQSKHCHYLPCHIAWRSHSDHRLGHLSAPWPAGFHHKTDGCSTPLGCCSERFHNLIFLFFMKYCKNCSLNPTKYADFFVVF